MAGNALSLRNHRGLRAAGETLNRESNALITALRRIEKALNSLAIRTTVLIKKPILTQKAVPLNVLHHLIYANDSPNPDGCGIWVRTQDGKRELYRDIAEMPRDVRVAAARHLPTLLDLLAREAEYLASDIQHAKASAIKSAKKLIS